MRILFGFLLLLCSAVQAGAPVVPGKVLQFPADFGAHPEFQTEWWYVTGWLQDGKGKSTGFQVTFFRSATTNDPANPSAFKATQLIIGHAAVSDPAHGKLRHDQRSAREGMGLAWAKTGDTDVRLDGWTMKRQADGSYQVCIAGKEVNLDLRLTPTQPPLLQGDGGFSRKGPRPAQASYYYSKPQLQVRGTASGSNVTGHAWLDHEWSSEALDPEATGWDWIGANLDDGSALMAFQVRNRQGGKLWAHAALRDRNGQLTQFDTGEVSFHPQASWRSPRTGASYPVATTIRTGSTAWQIKPLQQDQELDSRRSTGAVYWEGAVTVDRDGKPAGRGYLEMTGYDKPMKL
jgi:predicted secreted hydrolase